MYTQCPKCLAIFTASTDQAQAYNGLVRCGHCAQIFHAESNRIEGAQFENPVSEDIQNSFLSPEHAQTLTQQVNAEPGDNKSIEQLETPSTQEQKNSQLPESPTLDSNHEGDDEEIIIEAPPILWEGIDQQVEAKSGSEEVDPRKQFSDIAGSPLIDDSEQTPESQISNLHSQGVSNRRGKRKGQRRAPPPSDKAPDMPVIKPKSRRFVRPVLLSLALFLSLLFLWQVKTFYWYGLAQVSWLRPYLGWACVIARCEVPVRTAFAQIDLSGTSVAINPEIPGGLRITVNLVNRAHFAQPYPPLQVTLTDREGKVVGQRTYVAADYVSESSKLLPVREVRQINIDLAQPSEQAVGYEVQLVAPLSAGS